ncbi:MAG: hypothetical protein RLZZ500_2132 [Bacteroidota bacterium]|jgi:hypothetical protein
MNAKKLLAGGIVGGIAYFLLGWVVYGMLLHDFFPQPPGEENLTHIFIGSMCYGFLMGWVFQLNDGIGKCVPGIKAGMGVGLFAALHMTYFQHMYEATIDMKLMVVDTIAMIGISAIIGALVGVVNGKLS